MIRLRQLLRRKTALLLAAGRLLAGAMARPQMTGPKLT